MARKKGPRIIKWWKKKTGRKLTRKGLVKKADIAFSKYIVARDKYCVTCPNIERNTLTCGHLFTRVYYSTRWDEDNAFCTCNKCNLLHERDPFPLTQYFLLKNSISAYNDLHSKAKQIHKLTDEDLANIILLYEKKLNALQD